MSTWFSLQLSKLLPHFPPNSACSPLSLFLSLSLLKKSCVEAERLESITGNNKEGRKETQALIFDLVAMALIRNSAFTFVFPLALTLVLVVPMVRGNAEGDALYALRRSLSDPEKVLQSWDPTLVNPCTWFHITCNQDNRVTRLDLGNSKLSGHLVPELGKLEHLQYLELYKNNIKGTIPAEIGNLKRLISLDLYDNNITGRIPTSLGKLKSLVFLRLNDNRLTGPIPREIGGISTLKVVDVSSNDLCGTIPSNGPFEHISLNNFENNPRLEGPELLGLAPYDTNCS